MKNVINSILVVLALSCSGQVIAGEDVPAIAMRSHLEGMLNSSKGQLNLTELKSMANENNSDIEVAFQNYIIAKKQVTIARSALNPITTAQVLGMSLGLTYLWTPIALEAVLSIPTKLYNISTNKYLAKAALFNSYQAKLALNNELAHLYYDILTHEIILKTIDQEMAVLLFEKDYLEKRPKSQSSLDYNRQSLVSLNMEKIDIYNLYVQEIAALKTLLMMEPSSDLKLAQTSKELKREFLADLKIQKLEDFAIVNSNEYKTNINLEHAAESNVKSVRWSLLSFSGLSPSYRARVRESKINAEITSDQKVSTKLKVRNGVLMNLNNLDSSLNISENYSSTYEDSIAVMEDYYNQYTLGNATIDTVSETSIAAIRDFRSKVVAQYAAMASLDDFAKASNFPFVYDGETDNAQKQIENANLYDLSEKDFRVVKRRNSDTTLILAINSSRNTLVEKVSYRFDNNIYPNQVSTKDTMDFYSIFSKTDISENHFSGVATIYFYNGHELEVKFSL